MTYRSKKDSWIRIVILLAIAGMIAASFSLWFDAGSIEQLVIAAVTSIFMLLVIGFVVWAWFGTYYRLLDDELFVRSGPITWHIPYKDITKVRETRNPLSGPALSLDRLAIRRSGKIAPVLISPAKKFEFLDDLRGKIPGVTIKMAAK